MRKNKPKYKIRRFRVDYNEEGIGFATALIRREKNEYTPKKSKSNHGNTGRKFSEEHKAKMGASIKEAARKRREAKLLEQTNKLLIDTDK